MKLNIHAALKVILLVQVFLIGYGCTKTPSIGDVKCGGEKLQDRIVGLTYEKDYMPGFDKVYIQSSYTNKCNKTFYVYKGDPYYTSSSVIYVRDDKQHRYSDDLYGCENNPGLCVISPPIIINNIEDSRYYKASIGIDYIKLKPNEAVAFNLKDINMLRNEDKRKYFKAKTIYILKKIYIGDSATSYALGDEEIRLLDFDKRLYRDGGKTGMVWQGKKWTLSKCTLQSTENNTRHYTCEFVKNILKEEDKWAK
ncbi:MAG: hypothetical protein P8Y43_07340 [Sulfurovaceae bacterium]